jgi:hypothetical protein
LPVRIQIVWIYTLGRARQGGKAARPRYSLVVARIR